MQLILAMFLFFSCALFGAKPEFSLCNKSDQPILIDISNSNAKITETLEPGQHINHRINPKNQTVLIVWNPVSGEFIYRASFSTNKDIYLNWNEKHVPMLYAQRGKLFGLLGVSDLGFSTENNIEDKQITRLPNPAYVFAGLPDPKFPDFCATITKQFSADNNGFNRASLRYNPDNCTSPYEPIKNLWRGVFQNLSSCYSFSK